MDLEILGKKEEENLEHIINKYTNKKKKIISIEVVIVKMN